MSIAIGYVSSNPSSSSQLALRWITTMSVPQPLRDALYDSISSGVFIDTKFMVFSKRNKATGRIEQPRALFANSLVVKTVSILDYRTALSVESTGISKPFAPRFHERHSAW